MKSILAAISAVALTLFALGAPAARAQTAVSLLDVGQRAHVTANAGAMFLTTGDDWSGASAGGALAYNLHPQFWLFGGYDHGFPINGVDQKNLNVMRAIGNVSLTPAAAVGFGYVWFAKGIEGGIVQGTVGKQVTRRVGIGALYAHVFSKGDLEDFEYARVYLNYHLLGKE